MEASIKNPQIRRRKEERGRRRLKKRAKREEESLLQHRDNHEQERGSVGDPEEMTFDPASVRGSWIVPRPSAELKLSVSDRWNNSAEGSGAVVVVVVGGRGGQESTGVY